MTYEQVSDLKANTDRYTILERKIVYSELCVRCGHRMLRVAPNHDWCPTCYLQLYEVEGTLS